MTVLDDVLLIDLGSIYWAAWHSTANAEICEAHDRAVAHVRKLLGEYKLIGVCCDSRTNFRKGLEPTYKANRPPVDSAAYAQLDRVKETLSDDGLLLWEADGFEADDVLATACRLAVKAGHNVAIVSADKDLTQLVEFGVTWTSPKTGEHLDRNGVHGKFGVWPEQMRDYLAIVGDNTDNVRGITGIGTKGAAKLLGEFVTLEQLIHAAIHAPTKTATPKVVEAITAALAWLPTTIKLVSLRYDAPIEFGQLYETREPKVRTPKMSEQDLDGPEAPQAEQASEPEPPPEAPAVESEPVERHDPEFRIALPSIGIGMPAKPAPPPVNALAVAPPSWDLGLEPTSLGAAFTLAKGLWGSGLYKRFGSPEAIWAVIIRGRELGMGALTSLDSFHVIEGKPAPHAHLLISFAVRHPDCEYFRYIGGDATYAEYETKRRNNSSPTKLRFTIEDAKRAGLVKPGSNWEKRPEAMLRKSAGVALARAEYPDAIGGLHSVEEIAG